MTVDKDLKSNNNSKVKENKEWIPFEPTFKNGNIKKQADCKYRIEGKRIYYKMSLQLEHKLTFAIKTKLFIRKLLSKITKRNLK